MRDFSAGRARSLAGHLRERWCALSLRAQIRVRGADRRSGAHLRAASSSTKCLVVAQQILSSPGAARGSALVRQNRNDEEVRWFQGAQGVRGQSKTPDGGFLHPTVGG